MPDIDVAQLDAELRRAGTPDRAAQEKRYLKSALNHYGVTVPALRRIAKATRKQHRALSQRALWDAVHDLWDTPVHERRALAVMLLELYGDLLRETDIEALEDLLREARTWALLDGLAANVVGGLVARYPRLGRTLDRWAEDRDFWLRRAAVLALLVPLRRGEGDFTRFTRYADAMLEEREFFVAKAIGWVLREASKKRPGEVAAWLRPRVNRLRGVTLREAVKYLPEEEKTRLLYAHRRRSASG